MADVDAIAEISQDFEVGISVRSQRPYHRNQKLDIFWSATTGPIGIRFENIIDNLA
jgi:hypothetical protein